MKNFSSYFWKNTTTQEEQKILIQELKKVNPELMNEKEKADLARIQTLQKKIYRRSHTRIWLALILLFASQLFLTKFIHDVDTKGLSNQSLANCKARNAAANEEVQGFQALKQVEMKNAALSPSLIPGRTAIVMERIAAYDMLIKTVSPPTKCGK